MTIHEALRQGAKILNKTAQYKTSHSDSPIMDSEILLCAAIGRPKEFIFAHPEKNLTVKQFARYKKFLARRAEHEPVAYITGKKEFYGLEFLITPAVLIPRPETELLIEQVKNPKNIFDIGMGSGAIAITLKKLFKNARIFGTETNPRSIAVAHKNAKRLKADIKIKRGRLLRPLKKEFLRLAGNLIIIANLPYLSEKEWRDSQPEIKKYEPRSALIGGKNGWELYEELLRQIQNFIAPLKSYDIALIIEIGYKQRSVLTTLIKKYLKPKKIKAFKDLNEKWRMIRCALLR